MTDPTDRSSDEDTTASTEAEQVPPPSPLSNPDGVIAFVASDDDDEVVTEPKEPLTRRGMLFVGARSITGIIAIGIAVVAIVAATVTPGAIHEISPAALVVDPVPAAQQRVCPGPLLRLGDESGQEATTATSVGFAATNFQATGGDAQFSNFTATDNPAGVTPVLLTLPPSGGPDSARPALAGSQSQAIQSGDLVGFAATACIEAARESWLVGGATDVGRTTLITLSNPTPVLSTVDLTIYGEDGLVVAPGGEGIVVPAGAQRIFSLAGFAPGLISPVIRVVSVGGEVVANLQQSVVRTLAPGGVEIVQPTDAPSATATIPGVVVSGSEAVIAAQANPGFEDLETVLRLFVPGQVDGVASVVVTQDGAAQEAADAVTEFTVDAIALEATEIPLSGLSDGSYTVTVTSTVPIVASARSSVLTETGAADFAWYPAAPALDDTVLISVPSGPTPVLHLANDSDTEAALTLASGASETPLVVPPGDTLSVGVPPGADLSLTGARGIRATLTFAGPGATSAFVLTPAGPPSPEVTVYR